MRSTRITSGWILLAFALALAGSTLAAEVTSERLIKADDEPQNWLMVHKDYAANRFTKLKQINKSNAKNLKVAFTIGLTGSAPGGAPIKWPNGTMEATPLVEDGFMYLANGWDEVFKVDVRPDQAKIVWKTDPGIDKSEVEMPVNRGLAFYKDMVLLLTANGHVMGLKKDNGRILFDEVVKSGPKETFTGAPLVVKDMLIFGASGGDYGARGWLAAFDLNTHKIRWRWYSVPTEGDPEAKSWANGSWKGGGGAIWATGVYDPGTNRLYWGVGNPSPMFDSEARPGDNLYTESTVALDADTGKLLWSFQYTPNDPFDYDDVGAHMLVSTKVDGKPKTVLSHWSRNGFYYNLDPETGKFLTAVPYVSKVTWTKGLDPKTGKPVEYDPSKQVQAYNPGATPKRGGPPVDVCPDSHGGVNYWPPAYSPLTGLSYAGTIDGCFRVEVSPEKQIGGSGSNPEPVGGTLTALDPEGPKLAGKYVSDAPNWSGATATAGHLVFTAFLDGTVMALDDQTLKPLYKFRTGTFIAAPPIVYAVDGKEYVAILGGGPISPKIQGPKARVDYKTIEATPILFVFGL
jgi:alcohol dehydrogenase (cytochrome c)